ncbi:hypothetical protein C804_06180 [Lachnospiraceae bacterium A4]|nr:hypothetical protein C804_06180 [Lachnospiraceae bacterium A4]
MSPEPTGVHGLLKQRKLFTHKNYGIQIFIQYFHTLLIEEKLKTMPEQ